MAALAGIFNHAMSAGQALTDTSMTSKANAANVADSANSTATTSGTSSTISANDFLTLLVTEMKNQDPTATTDPNEYINQLVNVNSLQQLISINQNLSDALGTTAKSSVTTGSTEATGATSNLMVQAAAARHVAGNLSVPDAKPAAQGVAHALDGRGHAHSVSGRVDNPMK